MLYSALPALFEVINQRFNYDSNYGQTIQNVNCLSSYSSTFYLVLGLLDIWTLSIFYYLQRTQRFGKSVCCRRLKEGLRGSC
jgi:hypothetical protein